MVYNCEIKEQPYQPTLSVRTRSPVQELPQVMGQVYGAIAQYLGAEGEHPAGPPFAAYHNMDMDDLDVTIGMPVSKRMPGEGDIAAGEIPAARIATCVHTGPYAGLTSAYAALSEWMQTNGYEAAGVAYEFYLNDPGETPPEQLMTQIAFPLQAH